MFGVLPEAVSSPPREARPRWLAWGRPKSGKQLREWTPWGRRDTSNSHSRPVAGVGDLAQKRAQHLSARADRCFATRAGRSHVSPATTGSASNAVDNRPPDLVSPTERSVDRPDKTDAFESTV